MTPRLNSPNNHHARRNAPGRRRYNFTVTITKMRNNARTNSLNHILEPPMGQTAEVWNFRQ